MNFNVPSPMPLQPSLVSPNMAQTDITPVYTWNAVKSGMGDPATSYYITVDSPMGHILGQWYTAEEAGCPSGTGTCSVTPATPLSTGASTYTWSVYGSNAFGDGPWSASLTFNLIPRLGGFNETFSGEADNWGVTSGAWFVDANYMYTTATAPTYSNSVLYMTNQYANFDLIASLRRSADGCDWCDNSLYVRGNPGTVSDHGYWQYGYQFTYANDGTYSVQKVVDGGWTVIQDYTYTPMIGIDGWNALRVIASDGNLYFYINGTLVWSGADPTFTAGYVGVEMYNEVVDPNDKLEVDWAVLSRYDDSPPGMAGLMGPEQQALDDAANAAGSEELELKPPELKLP